MLFACVIIYEYCKYIHIACMHIIYFVYVFTCVCIYIYKYIILLYI